MDIKNAFLFFGIGLAAVAVVVSFVGLRSKDFPSRGAMFGLLGLGLIFVLGTAVFGIKLQIEEEHERQAKEQPIGEEASTSPVLIPSNVA